MVKQHQWLMALGQIVGLSLVCSLCGVFSGDAMRSRQFPGHLGPGIFIMAIGVAALVCDWHWRRRCIYEGRLCVMASVVYVSGETLEAFISKGGRVSSFYVRLF